MSSQDDSETDDLIQDACNYVSTKAYPADAAKNRKRIIRRKALRLAVRNGEVYYKKKKNEVFHQFTARFYKATVAIANTAIAKTEV